MLEKLVYRSKSAGSFGSVGLFNLLSQARVRNAYLDITGHLIFDGEYFTQWIEGPTHSLNTLWDSLTKDARHSDIQLISRAPAKERRFASWTMAFSSYASLNTCNIPGFTPIDRETMQQAVQALTNAVD